MLTYNVIPFLRGWKFLYWVKELTLDRGESEVAFNRSVKGWMLGWSIATTDALAGVEGFYTGYSYKMYPDQTFAMGVTEPPGAEMYCPLYIRPSTLSTAGVYHMMLSVTWPVSLRGVFKLEFFLPLESTQTSATVKSWVEAVEIINEDEFIKSARKLGILHLVTESLAAESLKSYLKRISAKQEKMEVE